MRTRRRWLGAGPALTLVLAACAGIGDRFREPDVRLDRVVVRGMGITGGTLDLVLDVYNPNEFGLEGTKLQLGFDVQDSHVGDVLYEEDFQVQEGDTTRLTLPVTFQWAGVGRALEAALQYGDVPYTMKGQATLDTPWGRRVVPFTKEGRAPLTRPTRVEPAGGPTSR